MNLKELKHHSLIWFGAAVSIAEILTGTFLAPLGFKKAVIAILLGHAIGAIIFYLAGYIGAKTGKSAMDTVKLSFGEQGAALFSFANILQLIGWTAIMILTGSQAVGYVLNPIIGFEGNRIWAIVIGALILIWVKLDIKNLERLSTLAVGLLFILTLIVSATIFKHPLIPTESDELSFGYAVELAIAMPLSWLPLIADYTRNSKNHKAVSLTSSLVYFAISTWMYILGVGAVCFMGASDIVEIMLSAGLGSIAVIIVIFSTVTTTYLDVFSAGISTVSIFPKASERNFAVLATLVGTLLAIATPADHFEGFLYVIGSVFAPMFAILITDYFLLKADYSGISINISNIVVWLIGFTLYRLMMSFDFIIGITVPVMMITAFIRLAVNGGYKLVYAKQS